MMERNNNSQAYYTKNLRVNTHFTLRTIDLPTFISQVHSLVSKPIPTMFIPCTVPFANEENGIRVVNKMDYVKSLNIDFDLIEDSILSMFDSGLGRHFSLEDRGRGDLLKYNNNPGNRKKQTTKDKSLSVLSVGYSNQDCHRYSESRLTMQGHVTPFLRDADLSKTIKWHLFNAITSILSSNCFDDCFQMKSLDEETKRLRSQFQRSFGALLSNDDPDLDFRVEGITILAAEHLAPHRDKQNSGLPSMDDVVTFTVHIPMSYLKSGCLTSNKRKSPDMSNDNTCKTKKQKKKNLKTKTTISTMFYQKEDTEIMMMHQ